MNKNIKKMYNISYETTVFDGRKGRYDFLRSRFSDLLDGSKLILDIGCDDNYLKKQFGEKVYGVDIAGSPDRKVDLEKESLKFIKDNAYELSICTEVLEHVDNFHEVIDDIVRVSSKHIIISLPNCSSVGRMRRLKKTGRNLKFYGLPLEKPIDRHKWFFSSIEIVEFFEQYAEKKDVRIKEIIYHCSLRYPHEKRILHKIKQYIVSKMVHVFPIKDIVQDVFVILEKK